ncbi:MAG: RsmD family RNA methyltransferase, partial [Desulfovibrio sp.]|nr:RsmD family RNA methyltransferase [Desulfovibrio sp.]
MRIIAGALRSRTLKTVEGEGYRPAMSRVRESLFSMLDARLPAWEGLQVLDLFAGSGSLAFEALSRGAERAWLVENSARALRCLKTTSSASALPAAPCSARTTASSSCAGCAARDGTWAAPSASSSPTRPTASAWPRARSTHCAPAAGCRTAPSWSSRSKRASRSPCRRALDSFPTSATAKRACWQPDGTPARQELRRQTGPAVRRKGRRPSAPWERPFIRDPSIRLPTAT